MGRRYQQGVGDQRIYTSKTKVINGGSRPRIGSVISCKIDLPRNVSLSLSLPLSFFHAFSVHMCVCACVRVPASVHVSLLCRGVWGFNHNCPIGDFLF